MILRGPAAGTTDRRGGLAEVTHAWSKEAVSDVPGRRPRPLAKAVAGRSPFGALLAAATTNADAAQGLAQAYAALGPEERGALLAAVASDARREGLHAGSVLAALLPVETDAALARRIAAELVASGGAELAPQASPRALLAGDVEQGGALIARPLYGAFSEVLVLAWERGRGFVLADQVSLVRSDRAVGEACRLPLGLVLVETDLPRVLDVVRAVAVAHRGHGARVPSAFGRFEDLLGLERDGR